jgi:hypothetical protein
MQEEGHPYDPVHLYNWWMPLPVVLAGRKKGESTIAKTGGARLHKIAEINHLECILDSSAVMKHPGEFLERECGC